MIYVAGMKREFDHAFRYSFYYEKGEYVKLDYN